ncbi:MAG: LytR family transcriptional regulator [Clostridia bacterium]|nr:LytR family transcriptional regulator [Clostridia bacterium]
MSSRNRDSQSAPGRRVSTPASRKPRKKRSRRVLPFVLLGLFALLVGLIIYISTPPSVPDPPVKPVGPDLTVATTGDDPDITQAGATGFVRRDQFYTFLLVGTMDGYNTDTIMLGSIDTEKDEVNVLSIPRDTMVDVPAKIKKINGAYGREGIDELCREVGEITGIYPDFYAVVNVESFIQIVDLFGGVEFDVPYNMVHLDKESKYSINLRKGVQTLNGKKALQMVRYRGTSQSDFGRMELQRNFLVAIAKKVMREFSVTQIKDMIPIVNQSLQTNMPVKDMIWFYLNVISSLDMDNDVHFHAMPGTTFGYYNKQSYVYLGAEEMLALINQTINPYTTDITEQDVHIIHLEN